MKSFNIVRGEKNVGVITNVAFSSVLARRTIPLWTDTEGLKMDWYERHPTDYKNDTWHLSLAEHGAYTLLLDHYYANECPLPNDDRALSSICNCSVEEWLNVRHNVIAFFNAKNGKLRQKNCDKIISKSYKHRNDSAKRSAKYRKNKAPVTHDKRVSHASTGQDSTVQYKTVKKEEGILIKPFDGFPEFWEVYPRKLGKKKSQDAYKAALNKTTHKIIFDAVNAYIGVVDLTYCKHPATWLNGECWNDVIDHVQPEASTPGSKMKKAFDDLRKENANRSNIVELKP